MGVMATPKISVENYVKRVIKAFLRVGSLDLFGQFLTSSKLISSLFSRKETLSFSVFVSNTLPYGAQKGVS